MGMYINPYQQSKEEWLKNCAQEVTFPEFAAAIARWKKGVPEELGVVWLDNGWMTAAAVAFNEREHRYFIETYTTDHRPRKYYLAKVVSLKNVGALPEEWPESAFA